MGARCTTRPCYTSIWAIRWLLAALRDCDRPARTEPCDGGEVGRKRAECLKVGPALSLLGGWSSEPTLPDYIPDYNGRRSGGNQIGACANRYPKCRG